MTKKDTDYWNSYYKKKVAPTNPSDFAKYINSKIDSPKIILDVGCGNGRDSYYFSNQGHTVIALDNSEEALKQITSSTFGKIPTICSDVSNLEITKPFVDVVYSRFSLHSLDEESYANSLNVVYNILNLQGLFCIEVRSVEDELYGEGKSLGTNTFETDHSRRFFTLESLLSDLRARGFEIKYSDCQHGWAPYKDLDPKVIRVVCEK